MKMRIWRVSADDVKDGHALLRKDTFEDTKGTWIIFQENMLQQSKDGPKTTIDKTSELVRVPLYGYQLDRDTKQTLLALGSELGARAILAAITKLAGSADNADRLSALVVVYAGTRQVAGAAVVPAGFAAVIR